MSTETTPLFRAGTMMTEFLIAFLVAGTIIMGAISYPWNYHAAVFWGAALGIGSLAYWLVALGLGQAIEG